MGQRKGKARERPMPYRTYDKTIRVDEARQIWKRKASRCKKSLLMKETVRQKTCSNMQDPKSIKY